ncbi:hypothetical protein HPB47_003690 [Ixodes persulcatus]|uniref:Uncharacterized protein n=1 Tax=Ixodes persulcatus TaxID=34615 RepID=A0AC60PIA0_IXOPE|nr:hypothetical protein HPB47_003690 [Ixodes persulcatus]
MLETGSDQECSAPGAALEEKQGLAFVLGILLGHRHEEPHAGHDWSGQARVAGNRPLLVSRPRTPSGKQADVAAREGLGSDAGSAEASRPLLLGALSRAGAPSRCRLPALLSPSSTGRGFVSAAAARCHSSSGRSERRDSARPFDAGVAHSSATGREPFDGLGMP